MTNRRQRASVSIMVIVLHAAAIAVVLLSDVYTIPARARPSLVAFNFADDIEPQPAQPHHPPIAAVLLLAPAPLPNLVAGNYVLPNAAPISGGSAQAMPAANGGCDLTQTVQDALRRSDEVARQLPSISTDVRSVANAIVVWNAGWVEASNPLAQAAFATIRRRVTQTVAASSADCRRQLQAGPRLVYLPEGPGQTLENSDRTIILALGSGQWSWQQLTDGNQPLSASPRDAVYLPTLKPQLVAAPAKFLPSDLVAGEARKTSASNELLASLVRERSPTASPYNP